MKIASKMMIGSGMPINQSNKPRPNPMTHPPQQSHSMLNNAAGRREFRG
jgi:hypothetical protein